ncbi:syntaxin-1A-like isoform X2 [Helicoverpa zea]|uniref:syntaxin-1A-like isoform X2 n=1 Tax=Helicoverpa zea TaxID=7113 RepID=UPI001F5773D9|nr:syntaxin-1A-like isoform X2 [Helicoverpa zea]
MRSKDRLAELLHAAGDAAGVYRATVEPHEPALHDARVHDIFLEVERMRGWIHELDSHTQLMQRLHADPTFHTNKRAAGRGGDGGHRGGAQAERRAAPVRDAAERAQRRGGAHRAAAVRVHAPPVRRRTRAPPRRARRRARPAAPAAAASARPQPVPSSGTTWDDMISKLASDEWGGVAASLAVSEEECEALLESRDLALFVHNVRAETAEARRALRDVEARHEELARLEAALADVRDLFAQLAHLVAEQQDQVDSVEYYALQASEHVGSGGTQLLKGTVSRTRARKKLSLLVCVAAGFAVVLLVLVLT